MTLENRMTGTRSDPGAVRRSIWGAGRSRSNNDYNWNQMERDDPVDSYRRIHARNGPDRAAAGALRRITEAEGGEADGKRDLEFFDVENIVADYRKYLFVGKSGSGKTTKAIEIMYKLRHKLHEVYVFTGSIEGKTFWSKYVPSVYVFCGYSQDKFKEIMERQAYEKDQVDRGVKKTPNRVLVIFEDLSFLGSLLTKDEYVMMFIYQGRHYFMDGFILAQYCKDFGPKIRTNLHYIFCTYIKESETRRKIYTEWGGIIKKFEEFDALLEHNTQDHRVLVIDNEEQSNRFSKNFYWFTVTEEQMEVHRRGWKVGSMNYRFNAELMLERQQRYLKDNNIDPETYNKYCLQRTIQSTLDMNRGSSAARGRGRGRKR